MYDFHMPKTREPAPNLPVARVLPLLGIAHLDRPFEYLIDSTQDALAQPGVRVRVRFGGRLVDALLLERTSGQEHQGQLKWLERVISPEKVFTPELRKLVDALAVRYAAVTSDLIRAALPSRHAKAEESDTSQPWEDFGEVEEPDLSAWATYVHGQSFVDAIISGKTARAAWQITPGDDWSAAIAALAAKVAKDGGGVLIVVPDQRDVDKMEQALRNHVSAKHITVLTSALGPQARYRRFLSILHGQGRLVIGTRSAAFAPVANLALAIIKDDGDENLSDPRAPYVHAREVLTTRVSQQQCSLLLAGHSRTAETQLLVESGWAHDLVASRDRIRAQMPRIRAIADSNSALERDPLAFSARMSSTAFKALRAGLQREEPVLIQVPRKGYVPTLSCGTCRSPARCRHCNGPLELPSGSEMNGMGALPTCRWCGRPDSHYRCPQCGSNKLRAVVLGAERTAEEIGRAFPGVKVITSGGQRVIDWVPSEPALVVSTPGAEPEVIAGRYGAAVFLDAWVLIGRQDLRAGEDTLAKWAAAATLVAPHDAGGEVIIAADASLPQVQALIRWDMVGAAHRELLERREVHFPPAAHMAAIDGARTALDAFLSFTDLPPHAEILGPVDLPPGSKLPGEYDEREYGPPQRILIRTPLARRNQLGQALRAGLIERGARKEELPLRIKVDPIKVG